MSYKHGIAIKEQDTQLAVPVSGSAGLQVVIGTAPVNLAKDPYAVTNKPIIAYKFSEAVEQLGYSDDFKAYTLCQSMDASFRVLNVAPIIFINVLDPTKHKKDITGESVAVKSLQATVEIKGILKDTVTVATTTKTLVLDSDYILTFDDNGYLVITLTADGQGKDATTLTVGGKKIDATMVTANDIVGGYDASTGKETGLELVRTIYPLFNLVPGILLAPGWSKNVTVAAALGAKCTDISGLFKCVAYIDLDCSTTSGATKYTDCYTLKNNNGLTNENTAVLWPMIKVGEKIYSYSAIFAALTAYVDAESDDVPNLSPSNKLISVSGTVLEDGTEVLLDQPQANLLNGQGIITAINNGGWRSWGNNTAAYPNTTDPKDRWLCCRRFFSWWGNNFILSYSEKVDDPTDYRLIESIVDAENIKGNSYVAQGKCAGARIEFVDDENPITDILDGKIQFHQYLAPFTPAEYIINTLEFDPSMIESALNGGE